MRRPDRILCLLGLLVAFALRVHRLGDQNIWWDEGISVWVARQPFVEATLWTAGDTHPPLYYWLLWPWIRLVGDEEFPARYLTVAMALLTVAAMVPLGRRLGGPVVGTIALWLLAISRFHIWWSQEIRMYALAALGATLSFYFLARALPSASVRTWAAWGAATLAALYTIYFSASWLIIQNLFVFLIGWRQPDRWIRWGRWLLVQGVVGFLWAPWLALALPRMKSWSTAAQPPSLGFVLQLNAVLMVTGSSTYIERYVGIALAIQAVLLLGAVVLWRQQAPTGRLPTGEGLLLLALGTALPPLMVWGITQPRSFLYTPQVEARYFLPAAPLGMALLAWALAALGKARRLRPLGLAAGGAVLGVMLWTLPGYYVDRYLRDDLQTMVRTIWAYAQPGDAVLLVSGDRFPVFQYIYNRPSAPADRPPVYQIPARSLVLDPADADAELMPIAQRHARLWLAQVESHLQDPQGVAERWLAARYARALHLRFGHNALSLFVQKPEPVLAVTHPNPEHPLRARVDGVEVLGYDLPVREFRVDEIRLGLYLRVSQPITLTVAMVGPGGTTEARSALPITEVGVWVRPLVTFRVTPYTPSGSYTFRLEGPGGETLSLGRIRVTGTRPIPKPAEIPHPLSAQLGDAIRLLGYGVNRTTLRPGETLVLDLYWEALRPIEESYTVFTHLVGTAWNPATRGPVWAQHDQEPLGGAYPTHLWVPGRPLRDRYELMLPPGTPPGEYILEVGMYRRTTGERLPVSGEGADPAARRIVLGTIVVR